MSLKVVVRRQAHAEFDEAFDWYEQQRAGLGVEFAGHVRAVFDRIAAMPELFAPVYRDVRKASVRKFPYTVFYRVKPKSVVVLAVFHGKRNPDDWKSRA
ncbi:MAG TPA: type II toxin-antitoxin system RelE/ParE family toxin [Isosphaeraceae bacterium]